MSRLARALRSFLAYAWDNPSAEQDARAILSAPKVGLWLGLEVLCIGVAAALALFVLPDEERDVRAVVVSVGTGPYLIFVTLGVVTLFLTLVVPLRAVGLLEGPRWRGFLDQLVTTGITPLRYHAGKWATCQPFFLALLTASLPFVMLFGLLGGVTLGRTLLAYVLLYLYANLLLLVTMALGVVFHEVMALIGAWLLFIGLIIVDLCPVPSSAACFTPVRFLIQPIARAMAGAAAPIVDRLYGAPHPFGVELPWPLWAGGVWTCLGAIAVVSLMLGPLHAFAPGLNNFGTVVLPGDGLRAFFRRVRPFLARRVELAFLFENRGPRLVRLTLPLRCLQQVALGTLLVVLVGSIPFDPDVMRIMGSLEEFVVLEQVLFGLALLFALYLLRGGWAHSMTHHAVGGVRVPVVLFDLAAFFVVAATVIGVHAGGFAVAWSDLALLRGTLGWGRGEASAVTPEHIFTVSSMILNTQITTAFVALLVMKAFAARSLSEDQAYFGALAFVVGLLLLPMLCVGLAAALGEIEDFPELARFSGTAFFFGLLSPMTHIILTLGGTPRFLTHGGDSWLIANGFWLWQLGLVAFLGTYALAGHRALYREAALLDRLGDPDPPPPPAPDAPRCAACESHVAVPAAWTGWGGVVGAWALGAMQCVDCRAVYLRGTGRPCGLLVGLAVMGGRFLVVMLGAIALFIGVHSIIGAAP